MVKIVPLLGLICLPYAGIAQRTAWSAGVLGSYGHYKFNPAERQFGQYQLHIYGVEPLDMWRFGVFARTSLGKPTSPWFVQAELDRSGRNAHAQLENLTPAGNSLDFTISSPGARIRRYDLAVLLGVRPLRSSVRLLAGPVVSYMSRRELLRDNYTWDSRGPFTPYRRIEEAFYRGFNRVTVGYQVGVGVEFWRVSLDLRRENNLTPVVGQVRYEGATYRANLTGNLWMLTLGARVWEKGPTDKKEAN